MGTKGRRRRTDLSVNVGCICTSIHPTGVVRLLHIKLSLGILTAGPGDILGAVEGGRLLEPVGVVLDTTALKLEQK